MRAWPNPPELLTETNETDVRWTAAPHPQAKTKSPCLARPNAGTNRSLIEGSVWPFGAHVLMDCRWATVEGSGGAFGLVGRGRVRSLMARHLRPPLRSSVHVEKISCRHRR